MAPPVGLFLKTIYETTVNSSITHIYIYIDREIDIGRFLPLLKGADFMNKMVKSCHDL